MSYSYKDDTEIYHIVCDISKGCRDYFYGRKYLPSDFWKPKGDISRIIDKSKRLEKLYKEKEKGGK